jgi:4-alpha-glucanotransferase
MSNEFWQSTLELPDETAFPLYYAFQLRMEDGTVVKEWGNDRRIDAPPKEAGSIQVVDTWNHAGEFENAFYTAPFQEILLPRHKKSSGKTIKTYTHIFKVKAPLLTAQQSLCLLGSGPGMHEWSTDDPVSMKLEGSWWTAKLHIPRESLPVAYKYGVYDQRARQFVQFEQEANRSLHAGLQDAPLTIVHDGFAHLPNNTWKGAGVSIPVFSLRSKDSFGTGEFTDLMLLADWAKKTGLRLIQILPVNDTSATLSWLDSYPYAAVSAFALHPIYLNLGETAGKKHNGIVKALRKKQKALNTLPELDYEAVISTKLAVIAELYQLQKKDFAEDKDYRDFFEKNKYWLVPYAVFCCLRDQNGTTDFTTWKTYGKYNKLSVDRFASPQSKQYDQVAVHYFTQYHLHLQLKKATQYLHEQGIVLKGDIPIGIYRYSCDAWMSPDLYRMDRQAGAPPDPFAVKGQNWGFPTYNWQQMAKDGFAWWKNRFGQMSHYFDAFRIDHILGFFRIWSIPLTETEGIMGVFDPAIPIRVGEFKQRNIWFDHDRYTEPFINDAVLWEYFAGNGDAAKEAFLLKKDHGDYRLKEDFSNQQKIEHHFSTLEKTEFNQQCREGLLNLVSNVILFEVEGSAGQEYHFRIAVEQNPSFRYLNWNTQQQLKELYIDYFYRRQDAFWGREAMKKLPTLKRSTNMLVCGEDLGMVPDCVPDVMKQLGILSLEIQRMPKDKLREFFHPADAPYLSVVTPSTHDMSTIRGWWEENREQTQRFFNNELGQWGEAPHFCEAWINKAIVIQHLYSPAMWSIFQLQDLLGMSENIRRENPHDERINVPANPKNYWKYRMHLYLEELIHEKAFNEALKEYIRAAER